MTEARWFVGCACDRNYVRHTAVMLASIDLNGDIPEAVILVAAFDLADDDVAVLRAGAGRMADRMRIVEITSAMLDGYDRRGWAEAYSLAILGRLFLPDAISCPGARLLTVDSDMIVNSSLRPLFELDFFEGYLAACHDVPRQDNPNYFNSGLMLIDVDMFKFHDVSARCLRWIAEQQVSPLWPDQDALNVVVGHIWHRLDHRWNYHCVPDEARAVASADYESAFIAHFAAHKPWNNIAHPGRALYESYSVELDRRVLSIKQISDRHA